MEIAIVRHPRSLSAEIHIFKKDFSNREITVYNFMPTGEVIANTTPLTEGMAISKYSDPSMVLDEATARELILAFVEYARLEGFKNATEQHNAGKLEATEFHLQDLRHILKLDLPIIQGQQIIEE